jgi:hypothetical protein
MARKTVDLAFVKSKANSFLETSIPEASRERQGMCALVEAILFECNAYKGFQYLPECFEDASTGTLKPEGEYDATRRRYY